jgi:hypothetical protein
LYIGTNEAVAVKAYAAGAKSFVIVAKVEALGATLPIRPTVSGSKLTINVPKPPIGAITSLALTVPKKGTGLHAMITAGTCTSKKFTVKAVYSYYDASPVTKTSSSSCTG